MFLGGGSLQFSIFETPIFLQLWQKSLWSTRSTKNEGEAPWKRKEFLCSCLISMYPETLLLGKRNLKIPTAFLPVSSLQWQTFAQRTRAHDKSSKRLESVPMQQTKCSSKEKTHPFSGWQQQVATRLRTGQDTSTGIPERIVVNVLWNCHPSCRSAFPNYCTICSDFPLQLQFKNHQVKKKVTVSSQRGQLALRKEEELELTLSWSRRQWQCGKWAPPSRGEIAWAVPPPAPQLSGAAAPTTQHMGFLSAETENSTPCTPRVFKQAGGYLSPHSKWAPQRPNDKRNWRTGSVTELCKMKDLQILPRVWSNTCSVSRLSWDRVTALISAGFGPCNTTHVVRRWWFIWRHCVEEQDGNSLPQRDNTTSPGESHHIKHQRVGSERWEDALKQDTATSPGRSLRSAGTAALPAKCYHPAQRGISALFSSTATLRLLITLGSSSLAGLGEVWVHTLPHVLPPPASGAVPACQGGSLPKGDSGTAAAASPHSGNQHFNTISNWCYTNNPSIPWTQKKACYTLDYLNPPRAAAT